MPSTSAKADARDEVLKLYYRDRVLAHRKLFQRRHRDPDPDYAADLIGDFHSDERHVLDMVFRGGSKSTTYEDGAVLRAAFREFRFCLIVGNTFDRAAQRLHAIRNEIETNEQLELLFGRLGPGPLWGVDQLMLTNGLLIQAMGKGASLLGAKHLDTRPDFVLLDDLEDPSDVQMEKNRDALDRWVNYELIPALDPDYRIRCAATPHHPDALPMRLERQGWKTRRVPVYHPDPQGKLVSSWPARFPLTISDARRLGKQDSESIEYMEHRAQRAGQMGMFRANYLVEAEAPEDRPFKRTDFRHHPHIRTWHPVSCFFDPARTAQLSSSFTGFAAWSWLGPKLIVWESWAKHLMPNEIVDAVFKADADHKPIEIGVELDGLEQFLLQPIRIEQLHRGHLSLPVKGMRAPKGKKDFIRALQPLFKANLVEFVSAQPDLEAELLAFPSGKIDALNALAYALPMRGGAAVYGEFGEEHVSDDLSPAPRERTYLALHATRTLVSAVLAQFLDGVLRVYRDWVVEGEAAEVLPGVLASARLEAQGGLGLIAPPEHFGIYNVGLKQAVERSKARLNRGGDPRKGREAMREALQRRVRHVPAVMVSQDARWTLAAFSGGYKFALLKQGVLAAEPETNQHRLVMEGLESMLAAAVMSSTEEDDEGRNFAVTPNGARYETAFPQRS